MKQRAEWRFFWPHAMDDMTGALPRSKPPTPDEVAEFRADVPECWVERRVVYEDSWERMSEAWGQ